MTPGAGGGGMKIIKIEKCGECKDTIENRFCYPQSETFGRLIKIDPGTIHPDCPLEDAGELAELREKAAKWDKVESYIKGECTLCPACGACMHVNYCILNTVKYDILTEGQLKHMTKSDALEDKEAK